MEHDELRDLALGASTPGWIPRVELARSPILVRALLEWLHP
jgi:hypothetical protein